MQRRRVVCEGWRELRHDATPRGGSAASPEPAVPRLVDAWSHTAGSRGSTRMRAIRLRRIASTRNSQPSRLIRSPATGMCPSFVSTQPATVSYSSDSRRRARARCASSTGKRPSTTQLGVRDAPDVAVSVELVGDLADDLLDDVLDRRDAGRAAVLVDDDRHVVARRPHLREQCRGCRFVSGTKNGGRIRSATGRLLASFEAAPTRCPSAAARRRSCRGPRDRQAAREARAAEHLRARPATAGVSSDIMSTRGTMTSRATVSPSSKISWIMRFSSSSRLPCSVTSSLISSSGHPGARPRATGPRRETSLVETGAATRRGERRREDGERAATARRRARRAGVRSVWGQLAQDQRHVADHQRHGEDRKPGRERASSGIPSRGSTPRPARRADGAVGDATNPTSVMPIWMVASSRVGSSVSRSAVRAPWSPPRRGLERRARAEMSAISAAAK